MSCGLVTLLKIVSLDAEASGCTARGCQVTCWRPSCEWGHLLTLQRQLLGQLHQQPEQLPRSWSRTLGRDSVCPLEWMVDQRSLAMGVLVRVAKRCAESLLGYTAIRNFYTSTNKILLLYVQCAGYVCLSFEQLTYMYLCFLVSGNEQAAAKRF